MELIKRPRRLRGSANLTKNGDVRPEWTNLLLSIRMFVMEGNGIQEEEIPSMDRAVPLQSGSSSV